MAWIPTRTVRRIVLTPLVFVLALVGILLAPLWLLVAFVFDVFTPGHWKAVRLGTLGLVFMIYEAGGLIALFVLWVGSGFGAGIQSPPFRRAHYRLLGAWLAGISRSVEFFLGLTISIDRRPPQPGPVLVFSRHAGPADSVFLTYAIWHGYNRYPRIVAKQDLQLAPFFDIMGHRLPNHFINPEPGNPKAELDAIGELASGLGDQDAFILFPEGGNFTPDRRRRAIASLERHGFADQAEKARAMPHLIPPRPGGALRAIAAAPEADVVFVAHTGVEDITTLGHIWESIPMDRTIRGGYWRVPPEEIPHGRDEQIAWLYGWWANIDDWIGRERAELGMEPLPIDVLDE